MVEKIIVTPESIRGHGNIIMPKTGADFEEYNCTMEVSEDTINNEDVTVYILTPETTTISLVLSSDVSTVTVGGNVVLSVTVTEDGEPVSGQSVSFNLGSTEIGTGTTNSSGVATYTHTTASSGSLNYSAVYSGHSSNTVSVVCSKRTATATIGVSSSSVTVGTNVTLTGTIKYNNTGINGLAVTFKEGTTTVGTGTTNSSGIATCTVSDLAVGSYSFTATSEETEMYTSATSSSASVTVNKKSSTTSLTLSDSSVLVGTDVTAFATVTASSTGVANVTVTFKDGNTTLGTATTNSNGSASFNITGLSVGSHSITANWEGNDTISSSTSTSKSLTILDHSYSLAFSQSSYAASGGSATLELTLTDNSVPVSGATISISGSDSSSYSCITNSSGVGTVTVSNVASETTFTATFGSVSDTCTVTVMTYFINDDASADNSSTLFGNSIGLRNSGSNTAAYNSNGYYTVKTSTYNSRESMRVLAPLTGVTDAFVLEYDSYSEQSDGTSGLVVYNSSTAWEKLSDEVNTQKKYWYGYNDGTFHETAFYGSATTYQRWVHYKFTIDGASFSIKVTDPANDDATIVERTETLHFTRNSTTQYGLNSEWNSNRTTSYKNIQAYKI